MYRIVSMSIVLTLIVVLGITFFKVVAPFLLPLFLAGVAAILSQPVFQYFVLRTRGRTRLAAGLATATVALAVLAPLTVGTAIASAQLYVFATDVATSSSWDELLGTPRSGLESHTDTLAQWAADLMNSFRGIPEPPALAPKDEPMPEQSVRGEDGAGAAVSGGNAPQAKVPGAPPLDVAGPEIAAEDPSGDASAGAVEAAEPGDSHEAAVPADEVPPVETTLVPIPVLDPAAVPPQVTPAEREAVQDLSAALRTGRAVTAEQIKSLVKAKVNALLIDLGDRSLGLFTGVLFSLVSAVMALLIFILALYYFFADGTALIAATETLVPVHVEYQREMLQQFSRVVRAVVSATFMASLGQSVATIFALWITGFDHLLTLFVLCFLGSLIPMLGTWLVWAPCAVLLALGNHWVAATFLAIYGLAFVGMLDNVIRTYVLNTDTKLHPLLALISVLGGLQVMGLWGVFIGPIVASCLHALVKIFNHELMVLSRSRFGDHAKVAAGALLSSSLAHELSAAMASPTPESPSPGGEGDGPMVNATALASEKRGR